MVRRADVARMAGVTPAVVSYVTNNSHPVSERTRRKVLAAIEQLGYRPNEVARALATARTHTIGLITPDAANPFFAELASAIEVAASTAGYTVLLGNAFDDNNRELDYVNTFADRQVDGLIVAPAERAAQVYSEAQRRRVPVVFTDRASGSVDAPMVIVDNAEGARGATQHLIGHGRRVHACITGPNDAVPATERALGWCNALTAAGFTCRDDLLVFTEFTADAAYAEALRLLELEPAIDSILVGSDMQATGVLRALYDSGRQPGPDVSVVSFDGIDAGRFTYPSLTTVAQPFTAVATAVIELLEGLMDGPEDGAHHGIARILPTELVIRESCGCPPQPQQRQAGTVRQRAGIPSIPPKE